MTFNLCRCHSLILRIRSSYMCLSVIVWFSLLYIYLKTYFPHCVPSLTISRISIFTKPGFQKGSDLIKAHCAQFVNLACVVRTRDGGIGVDVRPQTSGLIEHSEVLLVLGDAERGNFVSAAQSHTHTQKHALSLPGLLRPHPVDHLVLEQPEGPVVITVLFAGSWRLPWVKDSDVRQREHLVPLLAAFWCVPLTIDPSVCPDILPLSQNLY